MSGAGLLAVEAKRGSQSPDPGDPARELAWLEQRVDGFKWLKGRKRHILVNYLGLVLFCFVIAASDITSPDQSSPSPKLTVVYKQLLNLTSRLTWISWLVTT